MGYEKFFKIVEESNRLVREKDGFVFVETALQDSFMYAFYLYIDGKVVEKSKYSIQPHYEFKTKTSSNVISVKFFYKDGDSKVSIVEPLKKKAERDLNKQAIDKAFISECIYQLCSNEIYKTLSALEGKYLKLNNKAKSRRYVDLVKAGKKQGCDPSVLQILSKSAVLLCEDRYTLVAHLGICIDNGNLAEANNSLIKLQYEYKIEEDILEKLRIKLLTEINKYVSEFELPIGYNPQASDLTIFEREEYSSIFDSDELILSYKEGGIYNFIEKLALSCISYSDKEKARYLTTLSQKMSTLSLEDAIYLNKMSISIFPLIESYQLLTELYFKNKQYYKSAYFLGFLDHYYTYKQHKLIGNLILKALMQKFEKVNKLSLFENTKAKYLSQYIEIEKDLENDLLKDLPSIKIDAFHAMNFQQQKDVILDLYLNGGLEKLVFYFNEQRGLLTSLKYSEYLLLAAKLIIENSTKDSLTLTNLAFESARLSRHYIDILEFCSTHHLGLGSDFIKQIESTLDLSQSENMALKVFIDSSPLKAKLIENLLVINKNTYEFYEPIKSRICYILHNSLPYASGGYATRAHGVANGLAQLGYEVYGINRPGYPFDVNKNYKPDDIELKVKVDDVFYFHTAEPRRKNLYRYDYMEESIQIYQNYFLELKPQLVLAASAYISAFPALIAAKRLGIPFIYEVRGFWEVTLMSRDLKYKDTDKFFMMKSLEKIISNTADQVFTLTGAMKQELIEREVDGNKVSVIPNSCFPDKFEPSSKNTLLAKEFNLPLNIPVIGYIGTFVDYEGLENLTEACGMLKARGIEFRLLLVGSENTSTTVKGPITKMIELYAHKYDIEDWLILPGRVPHEQVEGLYSLIDIAPFPRKPWPVCEMVSPMKPLEALAMKKAVVVSSVEALQEMIIDGQTGLVFDKNSTSDLADKLQVLILDEDLRVRLGNNGREWVEKERSWEVTMSKAQIVIEHYLTNTNSSNT